MIKEICQRNLPRAQTKSWERPIASSRLLNYSPREESLGPKLMAMRAQAGILTLIPSQPAPPGLARASQQRENLSCFLPPRTRLRLSAEPESIASFFLYSHLTPKLPYPTKTDLYPEPKPDQKTPQSHQLVACVQTKHQSSVRHPRAARGRSSSTLGGHE